MQFVINSEPLFCDFIFIFLIFNILSYLILISALYFLFTSLGPPQTFGAVPSQFFFSKIDYLTLINRDFVQTLLLNFENDSIQTLSLNYDIFIKEKTDLNHKAMAIGAYEMNQAIQF